MPVVAVPGARFTEQQGPGLRRIGSSTSPTWRRVVARAASMGASASCVTYAVVGAVGDSLVSDAVGHRVDRRISAVERELDVHVLDDRAAEVADDALSPGVRPDDPATPDQRLESTGVRVPARAGYVDECAGLSGAEERIFDGESAGTGHARKLGLIPLARRECPTLAAFGRVGCVVLAHESGAKAIAVPARVPIL